MKCKLAPKEEKRVILKIKKMYMRETDEENFETKETCWIYEKTFLIGSENSFPSI